MKKFSAIIAIMIGLLFIPLSVFADSIVDEDNKVKVYFFRGQGCSHCQEAEEFFDSIKDEYDKYYDLVDYEVWYNKDNQELMNNVADLLGQDVKGVPYIIIGKKTWNGYSSDYADEIKQAIKDEYDKASDSRYDIMDYVINGKKEESNDVLALILILLIAGGITGGIIYARKRA